MAVTRPATIHYLRENHVERSPHRVLVIDTETTPLHRKRPETQTLRLWCAKLVRRHGHEPGKPRVERFRGHTAAEVADLVAGLANSDSALWVYCHNLNFDLAVTELPVRLIERGYRVTEAALTTDDPWFRAARGSRRITVADSWSYLPASVEHIGELLSMPKRRRPRYDAGEDVWWPYCERDVDIVAAALSQLMDWWDAGGYGNWSITGPATGWSSYRHMEPRPKVLIDPDPDARALEADAITGGRRFVRRVGRYPRGLYADLDMATAHLQVMRSFRLPWRRLRRFESMAIDDAHLSALWTDILARVEIETASPRYPLRTAHGVFYPVGRFETTLAGPEIREAAQRGELRAIGAGWVYATSRHMRDWADWIAGLLDPSNADVPPAVRLTAKGWSRSVPGKWDGHTSEVIEREPDLRPGWLAERGFLGPTGERADFLLLGGERWTIRRDLWSDDAFPAVLAFVQSYTRVALGRLIDALGPAVISANTDGAVVDVDRILAGGTGYQPEEDAAPADRLRWLDWRCRGLSALTTPFVVRVKSAFERLTVISPQHLIMGRKRRLAGIPASAKRDSRGRYVFTSWPRLRVQIARTHGPTYTTRRRTVNLVNVPPAGWLLADGQVLPVVLETDPRGLPYADPGQLWDLDRLDLAPIYRQHALLRPLMATTTRQEAPGRAMPP